MNQYSLERHKESKRVKKDVAEKMKALIESVNVMGFDEEFEQGMLEGLITSHPTLVQSFMRSLRATSQRIVEKGYFKNDQRSQASYFVFEKIADCELAIPFI